MTAQPTPESPAGQPPAPPAEEGDRQPAPPSSVQAAPLPLPPSVTNFGLNLVALAVLLGTLFWLRGQHFSVPDCVLLLLGAVALPVIVLDVLVLRVHLRASTGLAWDRKFAADGVRIVTKLLGLGLTVGLIALAYWSFPEYGGSFYDPLYNLLRRAWPALLFLIPFYVWLTDGMMREPRDAYWQLGRFVLGHPGDARKADVANHFRSWLVKAFFFPLMFVWLHGSVRELVNFDLTSPGLNMRLYDFSNTLIYGVDSLFCTAGYAMSFRILDTHVRSAEPTVYGWAVALFCYQPFYSLMERQYVHYDGGFGFGAALAPWPHFRNLWGGVILGLITVYALASVVFGLRFSNLTHRGILTNGPYRYSKHPAYITKNISWWMVSMPFMPHEGWAMALKHALLLGCVNMIYFLRARTEEAHLSRDPTYVAYALWINEHGTLAFLGRWFPLLKYRPPTPRKAITLAASASS